MLLPEQVTQAVGCLAVHGGQHVGVGVQGQRDRGVTEAFRHDFDRYARGQQQRGMRVADVVQTDGRDVVESTDEAAEPVRHAVWDQRLPVLVGEDEVSEVSRRAARWPSLSLSLLPLERCGRVVIDMQPADAVRLGRFAP